MSYVSTAEINTYLGISGEDTLIGVLNTNAEMVLNNLIGTTSLISADYTEKIDYPNFRDNNAMYPGQIFYAKQVKPTVIKSVDGVTLTSGDYEITGNKVFLKIALTYQSTFPFKNTIIYTAGFATAPADIKQAIYMIVGAMYNTKNAQGLNSFTQGELSVNFMNAGGVIQNIMEPNSFSMLASIINKYKLPVILSSGKDRTII